jgi:thiamine biosynthesis lipoprotein
MWIDLGGIAKGYAVDRALAILRERGCASASVNAGGDLARFGTSPESVVLDPRCANAAASIELGNDAVATSGGSRSSPRTQARSRGVHVHGRLRRAIGARRSVSVVAGSCCIADALTKVVLADTRIGERLLRRHRAHAFVFDATRGWRRLGTT